MLEIKTSKHGNKTAFDQHIEEYNIARKTAVNSQVAQEQSTQPEAQSKRKVGVTNQNSRSWGSRIASVWYAGKGRIREKKTQIQMFR